MTLADTGTLEKDTKVWCLRTIVHGEALSYFDLLYIDVENADTSLTVYYLLQGLVWYFSLVNSFSKQKRAIRRCRNNHGA